MGRYPQVGQLKWLPPRLVMKEYEVIVSTQDKGGDNHNKMNTNVFLVEAGSAMTAMDEALRFQRRICLQEQYCPNVDLTKNALGYEEPKYRLRVWGHYGMEVL